MVKATVGAVWVLAGLCFTACGDGGPGPSPPPPQPPPPQPVVVRTVTVGGVPANLIPPGTAQLTATATLSDNSTQNVTTTATWESSNTVVASVNAGLVTARAPGVADISATFQGVRGTAPVSVGAASVRANPGGPYTAEHDENVTFSGLGSTSSPFNIVTFSWNCGQSVASNCDQQGPTPTFRYRKCGVNNRPSCRTGSSNLADYAVRLTVTDSQGNSNTATTTVTVQNSY
ncbi:MAG: hypothetical protein GEU82_04145 [Luteitalea sp.]|nr:hypothetical protein [Luteitalea sp.]